MPAFWAIGVTVGSLVGSPSVLPSPFGVSTVSSPASDTSTTSSVPDGLSPVAIALFSMYPASTSA